MAKPALRIGGYAAIVLALLALAGIARPYGSRLVARLSSATATPTTGTAVLETIPPDSDLTIDGKPAGKTPLIIELSTGHHVVEFKRRNNTRKLEIDVPPGRSTTGRIDWNAAPTGRLSASSDPPGARITVDGRDRGATPVEIDGLSVGDHVVVLRSAQGTVRRTVRVNADETALVTESIYPGFLKLFAPFPIEILEGTRRLRLDEKNQIILAPGAHDLQFSSSSYGYRESKRVDITPGQTTPLSLVPPPSSLTVIASLPATVMIDGERAGEVPLNAYPIALGTREIVVRGATGAERRYTRQVTVAPLTIEVDFSKP